MSEINSSCPTINIETSEEEIKKINLLFEVCNKYPNKKQYYGTGVCSMRFKTHELFFKTNKWITTVMMSTPEPGTTAIYVSSMLYNVFIPYNKILELSQYFLSINHVSDCGEFSVGFNGKVSFDIRAYFKDTDEISPDMIKKWIDISTVTVGAYFSDIKKIGSVL